jgi:hypothetical protein
VAVGNSAATTTPVAIPAEQKGAAATTFASFAGIVRSRQTHTQTYVAPPVVTPTTISQRAAIQLDHLRGALQDARIPNLDVSLQGQKVVVNGLTLTLVEDAGSVTVTGAAVGLDRSRVDAAVKKLVMLANAFKVVTLIDGNAHMMVSPTVLVEPNGRLKVVTTAHVRVDPALASQHQSVLDQMRGGLTAPEIERRRRREQGTRTQVVG